MMPIPSGKSPVIILRKRPKYLVPQAIAIGSSTGGPEALVKLFKNMTGKIIHSPVFITQHLPAAFTSLLASHIQAASGNRCIQPEDGELISPATVYLAPGDFHMEVKKHEDGKLRICLTKAPLEHSCRPSINPMLRSLVDIYGNHILAVILTGMGHDGLEGCKVLSEKGGIILAQDQASSIVWGMPGTVAVQGLCTAVLPLDDIASHIRNIMGSRL